MCGPSKRRIHTHASTTMDEWNATAIASAITASTAPPKKKARSNERRPIHMTLTLPVPAEREDRDAVHEDGPHAELEQTGAEAREIGRAEEDDLPREPDHGSRRQERARGAEPRG